MRNGCLTAAGLVAAMPASAVASTGCSVGFPVGRFDFAEFLIRNFDLVSTGLLFTLTAGLLMQKRRMPRILLLSSAELATR